jgi:diaminopimelate epimerase
MRAIQFIKMHGLGNDFVILDARRLPIDLSQEQRVFLSNRRRGIGCDQLIVISRPRPTDSEKACAVMQIYNPDGGEAEACGNATRCVAQLLGNELGVSAVYIQTKDRLLHCKIIDGGEVTVNMGPISHEWQKIPLKSEADTHRLQLNLPEKWHFLPPPIAANAGNPHCVFIMDDVTNLDIADIGAIVEKHPLFPNKTNVEFVSPLSDNKFRLRVWERGAGITDACGSGACATVSALHISGCIQPNHIIHLEMDGGILTMRLDDDGNVHMQGPAIYVYDGVINLPL